MSDDLQSTKSGKYNCVYWHSLVPPCWCLCTVSRKNTCVDPGYGGKKLLTIWSIKYKLYVCGFTIAGVNTGYVGINGHISQIPGLSPTICTPPEERARGRRAGVLESDTDYVKLAKQGGHKGKAILLHVISAQIPLTGTEVAKVYTFFTQVRTIDFYFYFLKRTLIQLMSSGKSTLWNVLKV